MIVEKDWGYYIVLLEGNGYLVKELTIKPGKYLSNQRHQHRKEEWLVVSGSINVVLQTDRALQRSLYSMRVTNLQYQKKRGIMLAIWVTKMPR